MKGDCKLQRRMVENVATKQIYVKEADLPIFAKAEKYGNSLANVVAEALRQYVEKKEAEEDADGHAPIDLEIGQYLPGPAETKVIRFIGKQVAKLTLEPDSQIQDPMDDVTQYWEAYQTKKNNFVIWKKERRMEPINNDGDLEVVENAEHLVLDALPEETDSPCVINKWKIPNRLLSMMRKATKKKEVIIELDI